MDIEPWLGTASIVGTVIGTTIAGLVWGKKAGKAPTEVDTPVLAASIVPATEMKALADVMRLLLPPLNRLVELLEDDAHRRELEAEVRQVLKDRGIEL